MKWDTINKKWEFTETPQQLSWHKGRHLFVTISNRFTNSKKWNVYAEEDNRVSLRVPQILTKKEALNVAKKYIESVTWW